MKRSSRIKPVSTLIFYLFFSQLAFAENFACTYPNLILWPSVRPIWSLCWVAPDSSSGIDGSGLELRDVFFRGKRVLRRAGLPILNVNYTPGGCGSYRDWQNGLADFEVDDPITLPDSRFTWTTKPVRTMCDHSGNDAGSFSGVAAQATTEQLILTTQMQSGPYRYTQKWIFRRDGVIDARVAFTSIQDPCNAKPHDHHAYWRFEFEIGSNSLDRVDIKEADAVRWSRLLTEKSFRSEVTNKPLIRVSSERKQRGYEITLNTKGSGADEWGGSDAWLLRFDPRQLDDGGARQGPNGSAVQLNQYLNGDSLIGENIVAWVHASDRHDRSTRCSFVGPSLRPVGNW